MAWMVCADVSEPGGEGAVAEALRTSFQSLRARLVGCTLEDFSVRTGPCWPSGACSSATLAAGRQLLPACLLDL